MGKFIPQPERRRLTKMQNRMATLIKKTITLLLLLLPSGVYAQREHGPVNIDSLLTELPKQKNDSNKVKLLNSLAAGYFDIDANKSIQYGKDGLALAEGQAYKSGIASSHYVVGVGYSIVGNLPEARQSQKTALSLFEQLKNERGEGKCYFSIATTYLVEDNFPEALKNYFLALKLDQDADFEKGITSCYINIGNVYNVMKKYPEALQNYNAALKITEKSGDKRGVSMSLQNIANIYDLEGKADEALKNAQEALKISEEIKNEYDIANCYKTLGYIYTTQKRYEEALQALFAAEKVFSKSGENFSLADIYGGLGSAFFDQQKYREAGKYFGKALSIAQKIGSMSIIKASNEGLSQVYAQSGDYKKSLEAYKASVVAKDSMYNEENTRKTLQAQMLNDFDKKESLAKIEQAKKDAAQKIQLQRKNVLICGTIAAFVVFIIVGLLLFRQRNLKANQERIELEQKQLRAQMNPHFIFNCLNSIQHFVVANDIKNANKYLSGFALIMRQTLENSKESNITLRKEITYIKNYLSLELMLFEDKFAYEISCSDDIDTDTVEIPTMIIQPFIENAIRHGMAYLKDKKGELSVKFYKENGNLYCKIDDNGIGREQSQKLKIVSEMVYESQGMELTRQRLALVSKSVGSDYDIQITDKKNASNEPEGTTITIKFPLDA